MDIDMDALKREAREREIGELAQGDLGDLIERAVRDGLRAADFKGSMAREAEAVTNAVVRALRESTPESVEEVANAIEHDGGFMRVGQANAIVNGRFIPAGTLISALSILRRRDVERATT